MSRYWIVFIAAMVFAIGSGIGESWIKRRYPGKKAARIIPYVVMFFVCVFLQWGLDTILFPE